MNSNLLLLFLSLYGCPLWLLYAYLHLLLLLIYRDFQKLNLFSDKLTKKVYDELAPLDHRRIDRLTNSYVPANNEICVLLSRIRSMIVASRVCVSLLGEQCTSYNADDIMKLHLRLLG